ncbi:MAG: hypothetical protein HN916_17455 [Anaerolineae bacterium]|nr:hypothetical protein [Anaerolineae bacterium]MBT7782917.1 hypothetical protein [Anaerolineae bacterium]
MIKIEKRVLSLLVVFIMLFSAFALPSTVLATGGACDPGTTGDDDITCTGDTTGDVEADEGNDTIKIETDATVNGFVSGSYDNDDITNDGTVTGFIMGGSGDDTITNNGIVLGDIKDKSGDVYSEPQCQDHKMTKLRWINVSGD